MEMTAWRSSAGMCLAAAVVLAVAGCRGAAGETSAAIAAGPPADDARGMPAGPVSMAQVLRGRQLVVNRDCGACHGGNPNPASDRWLVGNPYDSVGPFATWAANLTPHPTTGTGRYTVRQLFNALRYGLRPSATPDVEITSNVPGEGNHPTSPNYLAPTMPWVFWRYMTDQQLWDIAAYLRHGVRPVDNPQPTSESPPDHWASEYTPEKIGSHVFPTFPAEYEREPPADRREQVLRGRQVVASTACSGCHGGALNPAQQGWLSGMSAPEQEFVIGPFRTRPRNLTPDNTTGLGRFSEQQIFNALRYGLRPGETPDVEITSTVPGQGNHPSNPKYLAPPMPWPAWRHLSDEELWAVAAYLKHGVRPVRNVVPDSDGPPDFWASEYTPEKMGTYPAPPFPTAREQQP